jgi:hypothetical protein
MLKPLPRQISQNINYKPESWRIHLPVGVGFAGVELSANVNNMFGTMISDVVGRMSDHDYHLVMVAAMTLRLASIQDFKNVYNGRRPQGGPGLLFQNDGEAQRGQFAGNRNAAPEQTKSNYRHHL